MCIIGGSCCGGVITSPPLLKKLCNISFELISSSRNEILVLSIIERISACLISNKSFLFSNISTSICTNLSTQIQVYWTIVREVFPTLLDNFRIYLLHFIIFYPKTLFLDCQRAAFRLPFLLTYTQSLLEQFLLHRL